MQYRNDRNGKPISALGYGCMRFSRKGGGIDIDKTEREILAAYKAGVNYYDTAYIYPGSEDALGIILERNGLREKVNVAAKLPQFKVRSIADAEKIFNEELTRLRTDYIDYYLMHHVTDPAQWERVRAMGIIDWIAEKKASGQIRNIGFSFHGNTEYFIKVLEDYDWDFCQIQYNYLDESSQAGRRGLEAAAQRGVPVVIMEPLRGGKLVDKLPVKAKKLLDEAGVAPAPLAFRWLWDQPQVTCVLSGMNSVQMVEENCAAADEALPGCLTDRERELIGQVKTIISETEKVGCTGCRYCMPCPSGVDIPGIFHYYNLMYAGSKWNGRTEYAQTNALRVKPAYATLCVGCGKCEKHCPQGIPIREKLKEADRKLRPWPVKVGAAVVRKFMVRK